MRAYLIIFALALAKVTLARPSEPEFSIDMYEGDSHLRYERSTEVETSGTILNFESNQEAANVDQASNVEEAIEKVEKNSKIQTMDKVVPVEEAVKMIENVLKEVETEASKAQPTEGKVHFTQTQEEAKKEELIKAENQAAEKSEKLAKVESKSSSVLYANSQKSEDTRELSKARYINKYGDILYRINKDKVNPLASKSSKSSKSGNSKKLSTENPSKSVSFAMINGQAVDPSTLLGKAQSIKSHGSQQHGFGAPQGYGAPQGGFRHFGGPAPFSAPFSAPFARGPAVHGFAGAEGTYNLRTNFRQPAPSAFRGQKSGIQMLNYGGYRRL